MVVLIAGAIFFGARRESPSSAVSTSTSTTLLTSTSTASSTTVDLGNGQSVTLPAGAKLTVINPGAQTPSLTGTIKISPTLPVDAQATLRMQEQTLISQLKSTPGRLDLWLQLGVDRKIAGDYQGAIDAWSFVAKAGDKTINYIAYGDLGDLYMNFLHDYPSAETNYKAAIAINPKVPDYYASLATMYHSFYKQNTSASADILAAGLKANPGNQELLDLQSQFSTH